MLLTYKWWVYQLSDYVIGHCNPNPNPNSTPNPNNYDCWYLYTLSILVFYHTEMVVNQMDNLVN